MLQLDASNCVGSGVWIIVIAINRSPARMCSGSCAAPSRLSHMSLECTTDSLGGHSRELCDYANDHPEAHLIFAAID